MALIFVKGEEDEMKPVVLSSGSIVAPDFLMTAPDASHEDIHKVMSKMKNDDIEKTINSLGMKFTGKPTKNEMIFLICEKMNMMKAKASYTSSSSVAKSSEEEEKIPSSGERNLMQYLAKSYKDVKGFHCGYYEGGAFHIFTPYGMYSPDVDDRDGIEFIRNHNCLILSKEDEKELMDGADESSEQSEDETKTGGYTANEEQPVAKSSEETKDTWTTSDEKALDLLEMLNSGAIGVNTHELLALREKKQKFLEKTLEKDEEPNLDFFDFVGISQGDWENSGKTEHLRPDINDFFENKFMVEVYDNGGNILLLKVEADRKLSKIDMLKADIIECVEKIKGEELEFGVDDFVLTRGAHNFKPYKDRDAIDGDKVYIHLKLRGGAKGQPVRKQSLKKTASVPISTTREDGAIFQSAFTCALNISSLTNAITLEKLMEQLSVTQLKKLLENLEHGTENIPIKIEKFAEEAPAWKDLEKATSKIEGAKMAMKTALKEDIYKTCSQNDKFKKVLLETQLKVAIGVKEKTTPNVSVGDVAMSEATG